MGHVRGEEEVDEMIRVMLEKSKVGHITQSVTFKKDSPRQMELLKYALMRSESFSALMKELVATELDNEMVSNKITSHTINNITTESEQPPIKKVDVGNFL